MKKTKAVRIEILPVPSPEQELETNALAQRSAFIALSHRKTNEQKKSSCVICGQLASHIAYFQLNKCQRIERYCSDCLAKWVEFTDSNYQ